MDVVIGLSLGGWWAMARAVMRQRLGEWVSMAGNG